MAQTELAPELIEKIQGADLSVSDAALGRELGVHRNTVRKYRRQARQERQEVAREVIAQHVEANIPDALADLTDLRQMAREKYEETGDARQAQVWLGAIKTTLEHVKPDDATLDAAIEAELARAAATGEGTVSGPAAGAECRAAPAFH